MKQPKKIYILSLSLVILLCILLSLFVLYLNRKWIYPHQPGTKNKVAENDFGVPNVKASYVFPLNKPSFRAQISPLKSTSVFQQSIIVNGIVGNKETPVFQRDFYADEFHGKVLTYYLASDSATIRQSGSLGTIGCGNECAMVWTNFYLWNPQQKTFVLDNVSHKDFFQQLLIPYQTIDKRGCSTVGSNVMTNQSEMSFTDLYSRYPALKLYCSPTHGILPTDLVFFLKVEKAIQEVVNGKNIGSNDIQHNSL